MPDPTQQPRQTPGTSAIWFVLGWAAALRILNLYSFLTSSPYADRLISDAKIFDRWALRIAGGDWLGDASLFVLSPLYAYVVGLVYTLIGHTPALVLILQSCLGMVCSVAVYKLAEDRFGTVAGVTAGLLYGSLGSLLFYETMLIGTSIAVSLIVGFLYFTQSWHQATRPMSILLAGLCLGCVCLLRPNAFVLVPASVLWTLYSRRELRGATAMRRLWPLGIGVALPLILVLLRNGLVAGVWTPLTSHGGINFYMGNHRDAPGWFAPPPGMRADITPDAPRGNLEGPRRLAEANLGRELSDQEVSSYWFRQGFRFLVFEPAEAAVVVARKIRLFLSGHEQPLNYTYEVQRDYSPVLKLPFGQLWFLYPLAVLGIAVAIRRQDRPTDWMIYLLVYAAAVVAFHVSTRYRMPAIPLIVCFAGLGASVPIEAWRRGSRHALIPIGILIALMVGYRAERSMWPIDRSADPFNLATSYVYDGDFTRALPWYERSRDAGGRFPSLFYNLGATYVATGNVSAAEEAYRSAIQINPTFAEAHTNLGNILFKTGRYEEAGKAYGNAIDADPSALNARAALGWVAYTFNREQEARSHWESVLSVAPDHPSALAGLKRLEQ